MILRFKVDVNIENNYKQGQNIADSHIRKQLNGLFNNTTISPGKSMCIYIFINIGNQAKSYIFLLLMCKST